MKEFNIEEAADWSDEVAADILSWLRDRPWRYDDVDKIIAARGGEPGAPVEVAVEAEFDFDAKIDDVLDWVGADSARAVKALEAENLKGDESRVTLVQALEEIATA